MDKLQSMVATSALYNGKRDKKDDYTDVCHPGTREMNLKDLTTWADDGPGDERLQWANAIAGAGKTAMMRTFCHLLEQKAVPFASFFIWQSDSKRNTLEHFPATIAYQLSRRITALVPRILRAFVADPLVLETSFENQMEQLIVKPLLAVKVKRHLIIVVDGLDELEAANQTEFLSFIPYFLSQLSSLPISVLVSSRPEPMIVGAFKHPKPASITRATRLGASDKDIWKFLKDKFDDINLRFPYLRIKYGGHWPSDKQLYTMVRQSSGLFIWPTVALAHIDKVEKGLRHNERLEQVLSSADPKPWIASPLDNLYREILRVHAPEDPESFEFLRFKQWLAYLCLPVVINHFVWQARFRLVLDWSDTPVVAVFGGTLDDLWDSMSGLSSLLLPRETPSEAYNSPIPGISHRSLSDFTFNRSRCGDQLYYSSERQVHAEVVCKFLKFVNTRQAFESCMEMSAMFIERAAQFLNYHLEAAAVSEGLGHCMDDVIMEVIPDTWPLVTQIFVIVKLFEGLYKLAESPDFPDGSQRRNAFLTKLVDFFKVRAGIAEGWDIAFFRLALSTTSQFESRNVPGISSHSVHCWHIGRSATCACRDAATRNVTIRVYRNVLRGSTIFQHAKSRLLPDGQGDDAQDCFDVLRFIISLSETNPRATQLSSFIPVIDNWIEMLLRYCAPNDDVYNTLVPIYTAPLPELPKREGDSSGVLVREFLWQTKAFSEYKKRCRKAGMETKFPSIRIPDDWWADEETRKELLHHGYRPSFDIPKEWWEDDHNQNLLLAHGDKPSFEIPAEWWERPSSRSLLLVHGHKPPFDIPNQWWEPWDTMTLLLKLGYTRPIPIPQPMTLLGSDSEYASPIPLSAQPQSLPSSSSQPASITPSSEIILNTLASHVEDTHLAPLPMDTPHVEATPAPVTMPVEGAALSEANGTSVCDVGDTETTLPTAIPPHPVAPTVSVPNSAPVAQTTASRPIGLTSDAGTQNLGHRPRSGGKAFLKGLFRRR